MNPNQKTARLAGLIYLLLVITGVYGLIYAPSQTFVKGDAAATLTRMLDHEFVFRLGIVSNLISQVLFIFLVMTLYRLLKPVQVAHAQVMVALVITSVAITFVAEGFHVAALMIAKGTVMPSIDLTQRQELTMFFLKLYDYVILIVEIFWGLWLIPFGILFYQSGFMPRILGIFLILGGTTYVLRSLTGLLFPEHMYWISQINSVCSGVAEIATVFWLLIKGSKTPKVKEIA